MHEEQHEPEGELRLVNEDELAQILTVQLACMSRLLPLRGKHGMPRDEMDQARDRLSRELASQLLRFLEIRRLPPRQPHSTPSVR